MYIKSVLASAAALSLATTPAMAAGSQLDSMALSPMSSVRSSTDAEKSNKLGPVGIVIGIVAVATVVGAVVAASSDDDDSPSSP